MRKTPLSITLSPYNRELLEAIAAENDRSLSYMVEWAIQRFAKGDDGDGLALERLNKINKKYGMVEEK